MGIKHDTEELTKKQGIDHKGSVSSSFRHAGRGILQVFRSERSFRLQILIFAITIIAGFIFRITVIEWVFIVYVWVVDPESVDGEGSDFEWWPGGFVGMDSACDDPVSVASVGGDGDGDVAGVSFFRPSLFFVVFHVVVDPDADAFKDGECAVVPGWSEPVAVFPVWCTWYFVVESDLHFGGVDVVSGLVEGFEEPDLVVVEEWWKWVYGVVPEDVVEHHLCGGCSGHLIHGIPGIFFRFSPLPFRHSCWWRHWRRHEHAYRGRRY